MTSFSVVIPTRNRPHFLKPALASVLVQTHQPRDIIVVDDGHGARRAIHGLPENIAVLDNGQRGPVAARNLGVNHSTSDCIAFLDDDDWWTDPRYLEKAATQFEAGADFCFGDGLMVFDDGRPELPYSFGADLISAATYRRSLHDPLGHFDEALPYYWDWDWYLRLARSGVRLAHIQHPVVAIRVHSQNMSGDSLEGERRANLDTFARKHSLPPITL